MEPASPALAGGFFNTAPPRQWPNYPIKIEISITLSFTLAHFYSSFIYPDDGVAVFSLHDFI